MDYGVGVKRMPHDKDIGPESLKKEEERCREKGKHCGWWHVGKKETSGKTVLFGGIQ